MKLQKKLNHGTVIVNAVESEPILSYNIQRIESSPMKLIKGLLYAMKAVGAEKGIIAIKALEWRTAFSNIAEEEV
ncbi:hypothetical protein [Paenibacillus larvae]|uniref:NADH-ubiquinone oxidoreductase 51kDa subunit FMN-binding domain-containing protein n=1 Tax=Paenibacillus larvae TaxID=1464 RepID=A0AAP5N474_9BACL|nr:hypothetical protein [Paenibacillus larvae]MDE5127024.1 hypothetical protein [Paenibacillus larvae subsp. larvae]MDE5134232.1 hypothetical protein [Paenibacillus larvae subsp. larvae]MDE5138304.1 hypothetical protein [Paenibacillus larvae subsp. larvae]MDE5142875.1 hypothetical protein [Paenibacillus larvae subsp. larvae]MDE5150639.1 hypothetical protein [Paenibacillus larvae subsp. larvae]